MTINRRGRARRRDPIGSEKNPIGILAPGAGKNNSKYPPDNYELDRTRLACQVATSGRATPVAAWLSLTGEDLDALRKTGAWHRSKLARLRRDYPAVALAMPPMRERDMRWRSACLGLPDDKRSAALAIDEHQRDRGPQEVR